MHLEYKFSLPDHDFPIGESHKLIPSVYASCLQKEDQSIGYSGPTFIAIRSGKHDKSCAASHMEDFRSLIQAEEFQTACKNGDNIKPLVFVSVDGGPDEAPKNTQALAAWTKHFTDFDFDFMCLFTYAAGSSAYNPVERRMAPLSKDTAGVILPFDTYGNHLNNSNKTVDEDLEKENFKAAGEILAKIWSESVIDDHPVVARYVDIPDTPRDAVECDKSEEWKSVHVVQSQYMLQIVKCSNEKCCKPFRTNFLEYFPNRFLPPPIPIVAIPSGLAVSSEKGHFGDLFQALFFCKLSNGCFDQYCPSLQKTDKKGKTTIEKRTCWKCGKYHSTIKAMTAHKRLCPGLVQDEVSSSDDSSDEDVNEDEYMITEEVDEYDSFDVLYV